MSKYIFHAGRGLWEVREKIKDQHFGTITKGIGYFYTKKEAQRLAKK